MADNIETLPLHYCYFSFRDGGDKHDLRIWVTPSLNIEYKLYINDHEAGTYLDEKTSILIFTDCKKAVSYDRVIDVYSRLLSDHNKSK